MVHKNLLSNLNDKQFRVEIIQIDP